MSKFKFQIKSKAKKLKFLILKFDIHLEFEIKKPAFKLRIWASFPGKGKKKILRLIHVRIYHIMPRLAIAFW